MFTVSLEGLAFMVQPIGQHAQHVHRSAICSDRSNIPATSFEHSVFWHMVLVSARVWNSRPSTVFLHVFPQTTTTKRPSRSTDDDCCCRAISKSPVYIKDSSTGFCLPIDMAAEITVFPPPPRKSRVAPSLVDTEEYVVLITTRY